MTTEQNDYQGGHIPLTPPPATDDRRPEASDAPAAAPTGSGARRSAGVTAIAIVTAVIGGIALVGTAGTAALAATGTMFRSGGDGVGGYSDAGVKTVDAEGITSLDLDVDASAVRVQFGDVDEVELAVTSDSGRAWTLERDGDELVVRRPDSPIRWFPVWFNDDESVVLTLPQGLSGLDADLTLDAGSLDVSGDFGVLEISMSAGALEVDGSADSVALDMSAGQADVLLDGVDDADLGISAGRLTAELTGSAPSTTTVRASAGSVDLTLPDSEYRLSQEVDAGSLDAQVRQSSSASRSIDVTLEAGSVNIRPGR